jgi:AbrB family looped-hinge helix DNA binding protein
LYCHFSKRNAEPVLATTVTIKGQVTLPKVVREAAGIRPGDRVEVRARAEGGVIVEHVKRDADADAYLHVLEDISRRKPIKGMTAEAIMAMTRGED